MLDPIESGLVERFLWFRSRLLSALCYTSLTMSVKAIQHEL
jgi:hypothetical protein